MYNSRYHTLINIGIGALFLGLLPLYFLYDPSTGIFPKCPFLSATGLYCTGCGSQRAIHDLLHLDLLGAMKHNALLIPALLLVGHHWISKYLKNRKKEAYVGLLYQPKTPMAILIIVVVFTCLRNIDFHPFNILAP